VWVLWSRRQYKVRDVISTGGIPNIFGNRRFSKRTRSIAGTLPRCQLVVTALIKTLVRFVIGRFHPKLLINCSQSFNFAKCWRVPNGSDLTDALTSLPKLQITVAVTSTSRQFERIENISATGPVQRQGWRLGKTQQKQRAVA